MRAPGSVTLLALNIRELRSGVQRLESALFESHYVAPHAFVIELLIALLEGRHCVRVTRVCPDLMLLLMTGGAGFLTGVRRIGGAQKRRRLRCRRCRSSRGLILLVCE